MLGEDLINTITNLQKEIGPGNTANVEPRASLSRDITELVVPKLSLKTGVKAQEIAAEICRKLGLLPSSRPTKRLTQLRNIEGYENTPTTLRFSVHTESLRRLDAEFLIPIPETMARIFVYRRVDDKAYYMDEPGCTGSGPRASVSPEPVRRWTYCTYCKKGEP